jgi:HAD superfamily phosphoserine phosphatase-like hydrolase
MSKVFFLDFDGTLTDIKSPWEFLLRSHNKWHQQGEVLLKHWINGEIDYPTFTQREINLLQGIDPADIEETLQKIKITDSAKRFLYELQKLKYPTYIISTGIHSVIKRELINYPEIKIYANDFDPIKLTAEINVSGDACPNNSKRTIVNQLLKKHQKLDSWAIGDSEHDEGMFEVCSNYKILKNSSCLWPIDFIN